MGAENPLYTNNTLRCEREAEIYEVRPVCCYDWTQWDAMQLSEFLLRAPAKRRGLNKSSCACWLPVQLLFPARRTSILMANPLHAQVIGSWVAKHSLAEVLEAMAVARVPAGVTFVLVNLRLLCCPPCCSNPS